MIKKKKWLWIIGIGALALFFIGTTVFAANNDFIGPVKAISSPKEVYDTYKNNTFPLMTGGTDDLGKIAQAVASVSTAVKEGMWAFTRMIGNMNAQMVKVMFNLDVLSPIKTTLISITASLSGSMMSIASTIGILITAIMMITRYIIMGKMRQVIRVFLATVMIFTCFAFLKDTKTSTVFFNKLFDIDNVVSSAIVNVNPVLDGSNPEEEASEEEPLDANKRIQKAGEAMASRIFYSDVYEPYLLLNYGTSNQEEIRKKGSIEIDKKIYDRIDVVLDEFESSSKDSGNLKKAVLEKETTDFKNQNISYTRNFLQAIVAVFYAITNIIQTIVFLTLGLVRIAMSLVQGLLMPLLPILLLLSLFQILDNILWNYGKAFFIAMLAKGMIGFAIIMFASYISLGFTEASKSGDLFTKIVTIIIYLVSPFFLYYFRNVIIAALTGRLSITDLPAMTVHPMATAKNIGEKMKASREERKQAKKEARDKAKKKKEAEQKEKEKNGNSNPIGKQPKSRRNVSENRKDVEKNNGKKDTSNNSENPQKNTTKSEKKESDKRKQERKNSMPNVSKNAKNEKSDGKTGSEDTDKKNTIPSVKKGSDSGTASGNDTSADKDSTETNSKEKAVSAVPVINTRRGKRAQKQSEKRAQVYRRPRTNKKDPTKDTEKTPNESTNIYRREKKVHAKPVPRHSSNRAVLHKNQATKSTQSTGKNAGGARQKGQVINRSRVSNATVTPMVETVVSTPVEQPTRRAMAQKQKQPVTIRKPRKAKPAVSKKGSPVTIRKERKQPLQKKHSPKVVRTLKSKRS
ncbi:hypothetical protein ACJQ40_002305 [Enterococcus faecium]|nr:hypothetical protein [Enterococcus faecium]